MCIGLETQRCELNPKENNKFPKRILVKL
jgi:hypothetical protein